jgi:peptidylprolyl isomerase
VHKGIQKPVFTVALRYQDIKVGTGAVAAPGKQLAVHYTGYRASDGAKFDSSYDHPGPVVRDKTGKPVMGDDGKPKMGDPQPYQFHQGVGLAIPGFDQGFAGMKVGGKRRIFIPWQLAYGSRSIPDRGPDHPGIPAMSNLIFDVELFDVTDAPPPAPPRPPMGRPMPRPGTPGAPPMPGQPPTAVTPAPGAPPKVTAPGTPASPPVPGTSMSPGIPPSPATPPPPAGQPTPAPQPKAAPAPSTPPPPQ